MIENQVSVYHPKAFAIEAKYNDCTVRMESRTNIAVAFTPAGVKRTMLWIGDIRKSPIGHHCISDQEAQGVFILWIEDAVNARISHNSPAILAWNKVWELDMIGPKKFMPNPYGWPLSVIRK